MDKPMARSASTGSPEQAVEKQREIQREQDAKDEARSGKGGADKQKAVQAGARAQPEPPLADRHLDKPGLEAEMQIKPRSTPRPIAAAASSRAWPRSSPAVTPALAARWRCCMPGKERTWRSFT